MIELFIWYKLYDKITFQITSMHVINIKIVPSKGIIVELLKDIPETTGEFVFTVRFLDLQLHFFYFDNIILALISSRLILFIGHLRILMDFLIDLLMRISPHKLQIFVGTNTGHLVIDIALFNFKYLLHDLSYKRMYIFLLTATQTMHLLQRHLRQTVAD